MDVFGAFEKMFPVLLVFLAGVVFARKDIIGLASSKAFADFAFLLAIPCYLFRNIYVSKLNTLFQWNAIGSYCFGAMASLVLIGVLAHRSGAGAPRAMAIRMMAAIQINTAYFAIPIFIMLFGNAAPIFPILLFQVCILSTVVVAIMEYGEGQPGKGRLARLGASVRASFNTPVIIACNAAIVLNLLAVPVPPVLLESCSFVGVSASPVALFALGLHVGGSANVLRHTSFEEGALIGFKCMIFPLVTYVVATTLFTVDRTWLAYLVLIAAMPSPQNLFIFAQRYDVEVPMAASIVLKSSIVSMLLLPFWAWWIHAGPA
jgi:malonate transporter